MRTLLGGSKRFPFKGEMHCIRKATGRSFASRLPWCHWDRETLFQMTASFKEKWKTNSEGYTWHTNFISDVVILEIQCLNVMKGAHLNKPMWCGYWPVLLVCSCNDNLNFRGVNKGKNRKKKKLNTECQREKAQLYSNCYLIIVANFIRKQESVSSESREHLAATQLSQFANLERICLSNFHATLQRWDQTNVFFLPS